MGRRPRISFDGAIHHVTSRGVKQRDIYHSPADRLHWLQLAGEVFTALEVECLAYCQMGNHFHLVVRTQAGVLPRAMQQLNGQYGMYFNHQHDFTGHVLQGRYHAALVASEDCLGEVIRYVLLNPVRAQLVGRPGDWAWSSCRAVMGLAPAPPWLNVEFVRRLYGLPVARRAEAFERLLLEAVPAFPS